MTTLHSHRLPLTSLHKSSHFSCPWRSTIRDFLATKLRSTIESELENQLDLNLNAEALEVDQFMGAVYTESPTVRHCRLLLSRFRISVKVEISREG
jgi:hypothetical protein